MYNKVILVGNLTRDPELRYLPSGSAVTNTAIATNRRYKKQDGSQGEEVCFIDIAFFGRTAEVANQYLKRGSKVLVEGRLKLEQWTDQNGGKRSKHAITVDNMQMLDSRGDNMQGGGENAPYQGNSYNQNSNYNQGNSYNQPSATENQPPQEKQQPQTKPIPEIDIDDDEIPF